MWAAGGDRAAMPPRSLLSNPQILNEQAVSDLYPSDARSSAAHSSLSAGAERGTSVQGLFRCCTQAA
eukprot:7549977-Alexandrium_andersonii.AAC.1